jgi:hypothetical protein
VFPVDLALGGLHLLLLGLVVVRHRRGRIAPGRLPLLLGVPATWLAYTLVGLGDGDGPVTVGPPLAAVLDALAAALLVAGLYGLYRWWRHGRADRDATTG